MKQMVFVWRESVYKNDFSCKCGTKLAGETGYPTEDVVVNANDPHDKRLFCGKCKELVGVYKVVDANLEGKQGRYDEEKFGKLFEEKCYAFGIGNLTLNPLLLRKQKKLLKKIQNLEGFLGIQPRYPDGTLVIFDTEKNAKGGRNLIRSWGIDVGRNIGEVYVDSRYLMKKEEK